VDPALDRPPPGGDDAVNHRPLLGVRPADITYLIHSQLRVDYCREHDGSDRQWHTGALAHSRAHPAYQPLRGVMGGRRHSCSRLSCRNGESVGSLRLTLRRVGQGDRSWLQTHPIILAAPLMNIHREGHCASDRTPICVQIHGQIAGVRPYWKETAGASQCRRPRPGRCAEGLCSGCEEPSALEELLAGGAASDGWSGPLMPASGRLSCLGVYHLPCRRSLCCCTMVTLISCTHSPIFQGRTMRHSSHAEESASFKHR